MSNKIAVSQGSLMARLVMATPKLPKVRQGLFEQMYQQGKTLEQAAKELGLTASQASAEHGAMLRSLRGVVASPN